jgi:murein DD-endopeptidase MepM/ murein hydrolase activator NlpD
MVLPLALLALATSATSPVLQLSPGRVRPGDLVMISVRGVSECPSGTLAEAPLRFFTQAGECRALWPTPVEQPPGELEVAVGLPTGPLVGVLEVEPATFPSRELTVSRKFVEPPPKVRKRMAADRAAFAKAFAQPFTPPLFSSDFTWPRQARITAPFGDLRTFNGKKQSQHYGMDLDGRPGEPIYAANDGQVVMTRDNYAAGQTVIVHHGAQLYTTYFHLSKMVVGKGERVKQGQLLGEVGATGRVTGPHLHFGVKVGALYVDPASLYRLRFAPVP